MALLLRCLRELRAASGDADLLPPTGGDTGGEANLAEDAADVPAVRLHELGLHCILRPSESSGCA